MNCLQHVRSEWCGNSNTQLDSLSSCVQMYYTCAVQHCPSQVYRSGRGGMPHCTDKISSSSKPLSARHIHSCPLLHVDAVSPF